MNRKRFALSLLFLFVVGATVTFIVARLPRSKINRSNYDRITTGMTLQEVEEILGGPERDETEGDFVSAGVLKASGQWIYGESCKVWNGTQGWIGVGFDAQDQVCDKAYIDSHWRRPTWFDQVKEFFGMELKP